MDSDDIYAHRMDRISKLPDELLSHIFSFLPFKSVVKTSILSKRWEYAWTFAPCLDLTYDPEYYSCTNPKHDSESTLARFKDFVDHVLFCHGGSPIQKCVLRFSTKYPCPYVYAWICAVVACNVRKLYVKCLFSPRFELPLNLFTCKTLEVLKLYGPFLLDLPFHVCFPSLKTLFLSRVIYVDDISMQRLFSSCPILEDLEIVREGWDGVLIASIFVPSLKRLVIHSPYPLRIVKGDVHRMMIDAPSLESLSIDDNVTKEISVKFSDSLVKACIRGTCASKVLKQLSHVKDLSLSEYAIENLKAASYFVLPVFHNLTSLWLEIRDKDNNMDRDLLSELLKSSPNLEVLVLSRAIGGYGIRDDSYPWHPRSHPDCLLTLKRVEFDHFLGTSFERSVVQYFLKHALVLEKMIIRLRTFYRKTIFTPVPDMRNVRDKILLYPRGSSTCQVEFGEARRVLKEAMPID